MRITLHGHRPAFLRPASARPQADDRTQAAAPPAAASGENVQSIHLGFVKLKVHRQTALQTSLMAALAHLTPVPAASADSRASGSSVSEAIGTPADSAIHDDPGAPPSLPHASWPPARDDHSSAGSPTSSAASAAEPDAQNVPNSDTEPGNRPSNNASIANASEWRTSQSFYQSPSFSDLRSADAPQDTGPTASSAHIGYDEWGGWGNSNRRVPLPFADGSTASEGSWGTFIEWPEVDVALSAAMQAPAMPNHREYLARWNAWASSNRGSAENRAEAVRRVSIWLSRNEPNLPLDLAHLRLSSLPNALPHTLTRLSLESNQLRKLPDGLPPALKRLDIFNNQLTQLPASLPAALVRLNASRNQLTQLPDPLPISLGRLDVSRNQITHLPDQLPASLEQLDVAHNRLGHLPDTLPSSLEYIHVAHNRLASLPNELPDSLKKIDVQYNRLSTLPEKLPASLVTLNAADNQLERLPTHLPDSLGALRVANNSLTELPDVLPDRLRYIDVSNNSALAALPLHLPASLERLEATGASLQHLPDNLPDSLEYLAVSENQLSSLPDRLPGSLQHLDVSGNSLTHLPGELPASLVQLQAVNCALPALPNQLPTSLEELILSANSLQELPAHLPNSLVRLDVLDNFLTHLPDNLPEHLRLLDASHNELISLPEHLPDGLRTLDIGYNRVTRLPEMLPAQLAELEVTNNLLTTLPETLTSRLGRNCRVELGQNPLPDRVRSRLNDLLNAPGYRGPQISFSMAQGAPDSAVHIRPLPDAVAAWAAPARSTASTAAPTPTPSTTAWLNFAQEPGAGAFSRFLDRLRGTVNFSNPQFQASAAEWLSHLEAHPTLRQNTFAVSEGATTSCEDRVSLTFNAMRQLRLAHDVEQGHYDERLSELLTLARGMFRLDQLEGIAREKTASLNFVDEIEVYLAFQVKLRESLELPLDTPDMRFFHVSYVTQDDLNQAETRVLAAEQQGFADHLATTWQPWQSVLQRLAPEQYAQAKDELIEAMGDEFSTRLNTRLQAMGLENDADAQRTVGPQVQAEITREINGRLTREFLASRGLLEHLRSQNVRSP